MARFLRQSTTVTLKIGPFVSPSDGFTPYTTGGFTVKLSANGGTLAARHDATAIAHDADGYYTIELDATDTATVGRLILEVPGASGNYLPVWVDSINVLSQAVYDSLFGATALSTYGGGDTAGTTTLLSRLTAIRAGNIDNLDAAISSRSTYAGADTAGTTTLLARLTAIRAGNLDNLDATVSSRLATSGYTAAPTAAAVATAVLTDTTAGDFAVAGSPGAILVTQLGGTFTTTASSIFSAAALANAPGASGGGDTPGTTTLLARLTAIRAGLLDNLDAAISSRSTYAGADTAGTTALLLRLTATRAGNLDLLDAPISGVLSTNDLPANFASMLITAGGLVAVNTVMDKDGYNLGINAFQQVAIEDTLNAKQAIGIIAAAVAGTGGTTSGVYRAAGGTVTRISFSAAGGERTAVSLNPPPA